MFEKGRFPSREAPEVVWGRIHVSFPFGSELIGGSGDAVVLEWFGGKKLLNGMSLATAGKTSNVNYWDCPRLGDVADRVKSEDLLLGRRRGRRRCGDGVHDAIKTIFHVGNQVFGMLQRNRMEVSLMEGKKVPVVLEPKSLTNERFGRWIGSRGRGDESVVRGKVSGRAWMVVNLNGSG